MSTLNVDKVDPNTGTALEIGTSGDTINVPSGVTLDINSGATLDATGATVTGAIGKVLQCVSTTDTVTLISTTSTTYVTNGIDLDITPSATSSKILLLYQHVCHIAAGVGENMGMTIFRDSTDLAGDEGLVINQAYAEWIPVSMIYLDSPSSTSSLNYEIFFKTSSQIVYGGYGDWRPASFIALEIGA